MKRETKFYAITSMGKSIEATDFIQLKERINEQRESHIEMYVAFMYDKPYTTQFGNQYWWPQIQIINNNQEPATYQRGMFKVKHIFPDDGSSYFCGRRIVFTNCITNEDVEKYVKSDKNKQHITIMDFYYSLRDLLSELNQNACDKLIKDLEYMK